MFCIVINDCTYCYYSLRVLKSPWACFWLQIQFAVYHDRVCMLLFLNPAQY